MSDIKPEQPSNRIYLDSSVKWSFAKFPKHQRDIKHLRTPEARSLQWYPAKEPPTEIYTDLLNAGCIPDPYKGKNEALVQWVGEEEWIYRAVFEIEEHECSARRLVCEGLDTYADITLNDVLLGSTNNAFNRFVFDGAKALRVGTNILYLRFKPSFKIGREEEAKHKQYPVWNADSSRLYVRKPQYQYGWDWGPTLISCGPWKKIYLESPSIGDIAIKQNLDTDMRPSLNVGYQVACEDEKELRKYQLCLNLVDKESLVAICNKKYGVGLKKGHYQVKFNEEDLKDVELWWPRTHGKQKLYQLQLQVICDEKVVEEHEHTIGFRQIKVEQNKLDNADGTSFVFKINNVPTYIQGYNWIPADSFATSISDKRYRQWLELAADSGANMIRVWGGGYYEPDIFYDLCDELGLLVWQDFMFACGIYPAHDEFVDNVRNEARQVCRRLQPHPCIAAFAGNNEDYSIAEEQGLSKNLETPPAEDKKFPARLIYEELLPGIVKEYFPDTHYQPSCPWAGKDSGSDTHDLTRADVHQWDVWHGDQEKYQNYDKLTGRFVSEFGMEGYPDIKTIDYWLDGNDKERFPQSKTIEAHSKGDGYERRIETYLVENFRYNFKMETYVYITQLMQAEALTSAYIQWKRFWKGPGKEYNSGALVWQLNDCWPTISWAVVDYFLRPKPAYHAIKRAFKPINVGVKRFVTEVADGHLLQKKPVTKFQCWATNITNKAATVKFQLEAYDLANGNFIDSSFETEFKVELDANRSTEIWNGTLPGADSENVKEQDIVIAVRILDVETNAILSRAQSYQEPFKYIQFPSEDDTQLNVQIVPRSNSKAKGSIHVSAERPVKGLIFSNSVKDVILSDNAIDVFPGDRQIIDYEGDVEDLRWTYLGDDSFN